MPYETGGGFSGETNVSVRFWISSPEDTGITCFGNEQLSTIQVNDEPHCNTHTRPCAFMQMIPLICMHVRVDVSYQSERGV